MREERGRMGRGGFGFFRRGQARALTAVLTAAALGGAAGCSAITAPATAASDNGALSRPVRGVTQGGSATQAVSPPRGPEQWPRPWRALGRGCSAPPVIAHRGEGGYIAPLPENTSVAELAAVARGASMLNADVRWTKDDVPVAIHDARLDRTTTGTGPVLSITAAQFTALGLKSNNGKRRLSADQHPQTLAQLLAAVKPTAVPIVLQMEADPFADGGAGQASIRALAAVIAASGYAGKVVVGGWSVDDVSAFSAAAPGVMTAFIQESGNPSAAAIVATGARVLYIDYARLTAAQIAAWHAGGLAVWAWTPPFSSDWSHLRAIGVDAIATNWVGAYVRWSRPCPAVPFTWSSL